VDDYDLLIDDDECQAGLNLLARHIRRDHDLNFYVWVAGTTAQLERALTAPLLKEVRLKHAGLGLINTDSLDVLGGRIPSRLFRHQHNEGRGYFRVRNEIELVQIAYPADDLGALLERYEDEYPRAAWLNLPIPPEELQGAMVRMAAETASAAPTTNLGYTGASRWWEGTDAEAQYRAQRTSLLGASDQPPGDQPDDAEAEGGDA
jgi:hypothetical protein